VSRGVALPKALQRLRVACTRLAVLFAGLAVTAAGAAIVPAWGDALLFAGLPICIAGGVRLMDGRSIVLKYGCGPFLGVMLFFVVFSIAETPGAAARRSHATALQTQDGRLIDQLCPHLQYCGTKELSLSEYLARFGTGDTSHQSV
jgi:hypothetical protein